MRFSFQYNGLFYGHKNSFVYLKIQVYSRKIDKTMKINSFLVFYFNFFKEMIVYHSQCNIIAFKMKRCFHIVSPNFSGKSPNFLIFQGKTCFPKKSKLNVGMKWNLSKTTKIKVENGNSFYIFGKHYKRKYSIHIFFI